MTKTNWILVTIIFVLMGVIGTICSFGFYVKGTSDGHFETKQRMERENWIKDYIQGGVPVCVSLGQVHVVEPKRAGMFKVKKSYALHMGGGPEQ